MGLGCLEEANNHPDFHDLPTYQILLSKELIAEAAVLQTKLKFIESESRHKATFERVQTMKQLEMAKAEAILVEKENHKYAPEYVESQINLKTPFSTSAPAMCLPMTTGMTSISANVSTTASVSLPIVSANTSVSISLSGHQTNIPLNSCSSLLAPPIA